jgi:hypothetical protein
MIFYPARNAECLFPEAHYWRERRASLRLEPEKNARRFEDRRFPLPVSPEEKIKAGSDLDAERFEAAKISKLKFGEHRHAAARHKLSNCSLLVICAGTRLA